MKGDHHQDQNSGSEYEPAIGVKRSRNVLSWRLTTALRGAPLKLLGSIVLPVALPTKNCAARAHPTRGSGLPLESRAQSWCQVRPVPDGL
jgi:hypothetical protein